MIQDMSNAKLRNELPSPRNSGKMVLQNVFMLMSQSILLEFGPSSLVFISESFERIFDQSIALY